MGCFKWRRKCSQVIDSQILSSQLSVAAPPSPSEMVLAKDVDGLFIGIGFGKGTISLGEIELFEVSTFAQVWCTNEGGVGDKGATFYKPIKVPIGFHCLGYYSQPNSEPLSGSILVVRENQSVSQGSDTRQQFSKFNPDLPALASPVGYTCIWTSETWGGRQTGVGFFWLPVAPIGYKALGFIITNTMKKPVDTDIICVRADLTDECAVDEFLWAADEHIQQFPFSCWTLKPLAVGIEAKGVSTGMFYCTNALNPEKYLPISILKDVDSEFQGMPNLEQIYALVAKYGPTVYFHPDEDYFPASVEWFFNQGALLYGSSSQDPVKIAVGGSNLPPGGLNDGKYWIDLPNGNSRKKVKKGNLQTAIAYVHAKPMYGGVRTDLAFWLYYTFNGPCTAKVGVINLSLGKIGEHVSDWEHFTLRINNFSGDLEQAYFSQHSSGCWVGPSDLEYLDGRPVVYASKHGHSTYAHEGDHLQGDEKFGFGIRNDAVRSKFTLNTSDKFQIIAANYLCAAGKAAGPLEPPWLQYMREWGPTVEYNIRAEIDRIARFLPSKMRNSLEELCNRFPEELSGEEGPTGPKEKDNWDGDERC